MPTPTSGVTGSVQTRRLSWPYPGGGRRTSDSRFAAQVNIHEAATHLPQVIERVLQSEVITVLRDGKPTADIVLHVGKTVIISLRRRYSFDEHTFASTADELQEMFYGAAD